MSGTLYDVLEWAKANGEIKVLDRIRIKCLVETIKEGVTLNAVTPQTKCSPTYLALVERVAGEVVGKPYRGNS